MKILLLALIGASAFAYIPEYSLIASRAADQHGRNAYVIEQDVTYRRDSEFYTVKETWTVAGEYNAKVTIEGRGALKGLAQGTIVYDGNAKVFNDGTGLKTQRLGDEWLEPFFHFRNSKYFRQRLVNLRVAPQESLRDRPPLGIDDKEDPARRDPQGFLRLARVGGAVNWAIGVPPSVGQSPTVWIEQDQFVIRRYRSASQVNLRADQYTKYDESFWYPGTISYQFGDYTITTKTLSVKSLGRLPGSDARFKSAGLSAARDGVRLPEATGLREFYSRFR